MSGAGGSVAGAPGGDEQTGVRAANDAVFIQIALRIRGAPGRKHVPEIGGVDLVVPAVHVRPAVVAPGVVVAAAEVDEGPGRIDLAAPRERAILK